MATSTNLNPHESINLIRDTQRLSKLKAIPSKCFCFLASLITGLSFGLLCNQSPLAAVAIALFPALIYVQKQKTGVWPLGFAPFTVQVDSFYSVKDYWQDILKVKAYSHLVNLLSIMIMLSFPFLFINILEFRDQGNWWAPMANGIIMALSHFIILLNARSFYKIKYNLINNE
jgi:hypothetical protein